MKRHILAAALLALSAGASFAASHSGAPMPMAKAESATPARDHACAAASPTMRKSLGCAPSEVRSGMGSLRGHKAMRERFERETRGMTPEQKRAHGEKMRAEMREKRRAAWMSMTPEQRAAAKKAWQDNKGMAAPAQAAPAAKAPAAK